MRIRLYLPSEDNEDYYPHHFSYDGDRYTLFFVFPTPLRISSFSAFNNKRLAVFISTSSNFAAATLFISLFVSRYIKIICILALSNSDIDSAILSFLSKPSLIRIIAFNYPCASTQAGYAGLFVPASTHNHTGSFVPLSRYSDITSYTRLPGFPHNLLLLPHFHAHLLLLHNTQMAKNFLLIIFSSYTQITQCIKADVSFCITDEVSESSNKR